MTAFNLKSKIESLLFIAHRPLSLKKIAEQVGHEKDEVKKNLDELIRNYQDLKRGIRILEIDGEYQMSTAPESSKMIKKFLKDEVTGELTRPGLETLTIIAYRGPISKPDIEQIRGVNCSLILRNLMIKGFVESKTRGKDGELLYNITFDFLRFLGIHKTSELPDYDKLSKHEVLEKILNLSAETSPESKINV